MKKTVAALLTILMLIPCCCAGAFAEASSSADVYVTICDADGELALAQEKITVTDVDSDGILTINDALFCAHESKYDGGAQAGYLSGNTEYGLSLMMLWGDESGSFGYYVNDASAWSLSDVVSEGNRVNAFVYSDQSTWSDTYCFFDKNMLTAQQNEEVTLTLRAAGWDADFNPITIPVEGADITLNGKVSGITTDKDGKAVITFKDAGSYIISATSNTQVLVPPVCVANVEADPDIIDKNDDTSPAESEDGTFSSIDAAASSSGVNVPPTGDASIVWVFLLAALSGIMLFFVNAKKLYEK